MMKNLLMPFNIDTGGISNCREISFELCSQCNLSCEFCCQQDGNKVPLTQQECNRQLDNFSKMIKYVSSKSIFMHIMGGELFRKDTSLDDIKIIDDFTHRLINICKENNIEPTIQYVTNLLTSNIDQIEFLVKKYSALLMVSFDFIGRYTKDEHIESVLQNLKELDNRKIRYSSSFVLTKLTEEFIKEKKGGYKIFEYLYRMHPDYIGGEVFDNQKSKEVNSKYNITYKQYGKLLKYLYDNYPNLATIQQYVNNVKYKLYVDKKAQQFCKAQCAFTPFHEPFYHCKPECCNKFLKTYPCLTCKHFSYCQLQCFRQATAQDNNGYCAFQDLMNYIENDKKSRK